MLALLQQSALWITELGICLLQLESIAEGRDSVVCISAHTGEGIEDLLAAIEENLKKSMTLMHALIPFHRVNSTATYIRLAETLQTLLTVLWVYIATGGIMQQGCV